MRGERQIDNRRGVQLLLWLPLFGLPLAALQGCPLTSYGEDTLLLALVVILAILNLAWRRWGDTKATLLLVPAVWLFLFGISLRAWPVAWHLPLGVACALYAIATWRITGRLRSEQTAKLPVLPIGAFMCAVLFVLIADWILAGFLVSEPRPWIQRTGFLWPVLFAVPAAYRLSAEPPVRRIALLALLILCGMLFVKEQRWTARLVAATAEAGEALEAGRDVLAEERLEQALAWNRTKRRADVERQLHIIHAALAVRGGEVSQAVAAVNRAIEAAPRQSPKALELFEQLCPDFAERLLATPERDLPRVEVWVDVEQPSADGPCWLLNRWGEIYQAAPGEAWRSKRKGNTRAPRAVDMVCLPEPFAALILYEDGLVETWGGSPGEPLEKALARYNIAPLPRAVDLEWASGQKGLYVLSASGRTASIGAASFDLSQTRHWRWKDDAVLCLKAAPDGRALYLLDRRGGVHAAGQPAFDPLRRDAPYTEEPGIAADIEFSPDATGLYFLDVFGGLHTIGSRDLPIPRGVLPYFDTPGVVDFEIAADGTMVVLTGNGRLYADRIPPASGSSSL